jgi:hypothetical protein
LYCAPTARGVFKDGQSYKHAAPPEQEQMCQVC